MIAIIREVISGRIDRRQLGATVNDVNVYGATTEFPGTLMEKLYARHRPTLADVKKAVTEYKEAGILGAASAIVEIDEETGKKGYAYAESNRIRAGRSACAGLALFLKMNSEKPLVGMTVVVNTGWMYLPHQRFGV